MVFRVLGLISICLFLIFSGCTTQGDLRREQELERLRTEVKEMRGNRVDIDVVGEELKAELTRVGTLQEEQAHLMRAQHEEMRKELASVSSRIAALEAQVSRPGPAVASEESPRSAERSKPSYEAARALYESGKFSESTEMLRSVLKSPANAEESKKAQYLIGESLFSEKEYASAAIEFGEFKKAHGKDALAASATLRLAQAFKAMGKTKEAKLFYDEVMQKYPKNPAAAKARAESKKLK